MRVPCATARRSLPLWCAVALAVAACDLSSGPDLRRPAEVRAVRGDMQAGTVGQPLADSLEVRVLNVLGQPIAGVTVAFVAASGSGTPSPGTARTDARGLARAAWTLGPVAGPQAIEATVPDSRAAPAAFSATAAAGAPASLRKVSGDGQTSPVDAPLPDPLVVQVLDAGGNGVGGATVRWSTTGAGGIVPDSAPTDALGFARAVWTLGTAAGVQPPAWAAIDGDSVAFVAHAVAGAVAGVRLVGEPVRFGDSLLLVHPATARLTASAVDGHGNPVTPAEPFRWTISDPGLAAVAPEPGLSARAAVATHAAGTARIEVSVAGATATMGLRVAAVGGRYTATMTGLRSADALSDLGDVVGRVPSGNLGIWRDGRTTDLGDFGLDVGFPLTLTAVNDAGSILVDQPAGGNTGALGGGFSYLLKGGVLTPLAAEFIEPVDQAARLVRAYDLDARDAVVGVRVDLPYRSFLGFRWQDGRATWLPHVSIDRGSTWPVAINERGQIAVNMRFPRPDGGPYQAAAYLWEDGAYTPIPRPDPACLEWAAADLDDQGRVLLNCIVAPTPRTAAFLWDGATFTPLAPLAYGSSLGARGEVVGEGPDGIYVWRDGGATRLLGFDVGPGPGFGFVHPSAGPRINDVGAIVLNFGGAGYLLTPTP